MGQTKVFPLYGMLSNELQREAIAPIATGWRKVVLATPIAETSITIEGVRVVIDSELCRRMVYDNSTALSRLETIRISHDIADQRAGRAGRTAPGICFRLWNAAIQDRMQAPRLPEIADADLSSAALTAALWGESDLRKIEWLTPPSIANIYRAENLLKGLGAFAALWHPEKNLPDLSTEAVLSSAGQWVPFYIGTIGTLGMLGTLVGKAASLTENSVTAAQLKKNRYVRGVVGNAFIRTTAGT